MSKVEFDNKGLENLIKAFDELDGQSIEFGVTEESDKQYPDKDINTATVALYLDHGTQDIDESAWLRKVATKGEMKQIIKKAVPEAKRFIEQSVKTDKANTVPFMETLRFNAEKRAKDSIRQREHIDTGLLISTVVAEVKDED